MRTLLIGCMALLMTGAIAQDSSTSSSNQSTVKVVKRIKIRHADPYLIMLILKGGFPKQPEYSTIDNTRG